MTISMPRGFLTSTATLIAAFVLATMAPALAQRGGDLRKFNVREVRDIIQDEGFQDVQQRGENAVSFKRDGTTYVMFVMKDGDLQLYCAFQMRGISHADMNAWNRDKRHSRAYIDKDGDPVIESDLLADAGLSRRHVTEFIKVFMLSTRGFRDHINSAGKRR